VSFSPDTFSLTCKCARREKRRGHALVVLCASLFVAFFGGGAAFGSPGGTPCADLTALTLANVSIKSATMVPAGPFVAPASGSGAVPAPLNLPSFCRVIALATPVNDSVINFEVWIPPVDAWNGKFEGVGNGGFSGYISYAAMAAALRRGYATASTDTGHVGDDLIFANGHPEKIIDWTYRAMHVTTESAQLIVRDYAGRFSQHSYFNGCASGGHQALTEAQKFPDDYDGIIAGDPAADRIHEIIGYLWSWISTHNEDGSRILSPAKLQLVTQSAVAACDALDGVRDGVIDDPRRCRFNLATLTCKGPETDACLTQQQVQAVQKIYDGVKNPRTGAQIFPGWPVGSEGYGDAPSQGWRQYLIDPAEPMRIGLLRYFVFDDPHWDWHTMDFDRDTAYADQKMGFVAATDPNMNPYKSRGGKLLMYTGWVDPVLPATDVIDYYEAVTKRMGGSANTKQFFRLFMVPGMGHCSGGPGTTTFDMTPALEQWVEKNTPPEEVIASRVVKDVTIRTRPLCLYPKVARWKGSGTTDDAANFACVNEENSAVRQAVQSKPAHQEN